MRPRLLCAVAAMALMFTAASAEDLTDKVKKAVEHITLDQPGTKPFHLKASLAPSSERDSNSGRTGEVEIWWASPKQWKREVRSPQFHQIEILNGDHEWQKNEGDYFPEWLREISIELIRPIPPLDEVLEQLRNAETVNLNGQMSIEWTTTTGTSDVHNIRRSVVAFNEKTGELLYAFGFGWGGGFKDYQNFHGRRVARTLTSGTPEVKAHLTVLEDLGTVPAELFTGESESASHPLRTVLLDETTLRKNLLPSEVSQWPALQDGPLEGNVTTEVVVDLQGRVRDLGPLVSENPAIEDSGRQRILAMRFTPFQQDGHAVQVMSQITVPFKTVRPTGTESFDSARNYFDRGRKMSFLAAGSTTPYLLSAEFVARGHEGVQGKGIYQDTWLDSAHWRREASFGQSHYVRSRVGDTRYESQEGPDAALLRLILRILEPIPALDTFVESDWRIKRDKVNGIDAVRVVAGYESPEGKLDADQARGYWFDNSGLLLKTYLSGLETDWSEFQEFGGVHIARKVDVRREGKLAVHIEVTALTHAESEPDSFFVVEGHVGQRAFTAEER